MAGGRPTKYRPDYHPEHVRKLALLGMTDAKMAKFLEISEATFHNWKLEHPRFLEALKEGREGADVKVTESMYQRAQGYDVYEDRVTPTGEVVSVKVHIPANPTMQIFWMKNRHPDKWRDKHEVQADTTINLNIDQNDAGIM